MIFAVTQETGREDKTDRPTVLKHNEPEWLAQGPQQGTAARGPQPNLPHALLRVISLQANLRDTAGSVPDHSIKANVARKQVTRIFWFPGTYKIMFTLFCSLLSLQ